jgi:hypothetical protein
MPISVQRGGTSNNGTKPPTEPIEETAQPEEMYAYAEDPTPPPSSPSPEEEPKKSPLRNLIPDTEEDFEFGFRVLREHEYQALFIPKDRTLYLTREDASKNIFKISAARLGEHLKELMAFKFPRQYLWDAQGMTPECVAELKTKISYTARKIFPSDDWRKYKRGELGKVGIENPKYPLRLQYWEEIAKRSSDYQNWLESYQPTGEDEPEVVDAEWVFEESSDERDDRRSKTRSQIELAGHAIFKQVDGYLDALVGRIMLRVEDKGLEARAKMDTRLPEVIIRPETTEEDEDL